MSRRLLGASGAVVVALLTAWACGDSPSDRHNHPSNEDPLDGGTLPDDDAGEVTPDAGLPPDDAGEPDAGPEPDDAGEPVEDGGTTDGGMPDGGAPDASVPDPWPKDPLVNYSQRFGVGRPQGVAVDEGFNIWLLNGSSIGVLKPGDTQPTWVKDIGQAGRGFTSTVICGGAAGRAYVGYYARELDQPKRDSYKDPVFTEGDLDAVRLTPSGSIELEDHIHHSYRRERSSSDGGLTWNPPVNTGIHNSNSWQYDEDRAVLSCVRVFRGRDKGELYIGTNHGVTRIRGLSYNSHRHPVWFTDTGSQMAGYNYGLGIAQDGDVLIANEWTFGIVTPNADLGVWDWMEPKSLNPMKVESSFLPEVNGLAEFDYWRGFQQTQDGRYYLASRDQGLWEMTITSRGNREQKGTRVTGLPTSSLTSLAATDDGSLFIGTSGSGLWRLDPLKQLSRVDDIPGRTVKQLVYDPTATPAMLYVLTDSGLTVIRGF
ncbi:hypothetical protein P2318_17765 [Myxococcaceae bacterium GXIMD 01537]